MYYLHFSLTLNAWKLHCSHLGGKAQENPSAIETTSHESCVLREKAGEICLQEQNCFLLFCPGVSPYQAG